MRSDFAWYRTARSLRHEGLRQGCKTWECAVRPGFMWLLHQFTCAEQPASSVPPRSAPSLLAKSQSTLGRRWLCACYTHDRWYYPFRGGTPLVFSEDVIPVPAVGEDMLRVSAMGTSDRGGEGYRKA